MQIIKVQFGKTYSLGNYCSERIDLEASIDETTETVADSIFQLRHYCDEIHKKNNPQLYQEQIPQEFITGSIHNNGMFSQPTEPQPIKLSPQDEENNLITSIESAKNEQELIQYKLLAGKSQKSIGAYNKRKKQLNIND